MKQHLYLTKGTILGHPCPECGAPENQYCRRKGKDSTTNHQSRVNVAKKAHYASLAPAQRVESEPEIDALRQNAINRLRSMSVSDQDKQECIRFLGQSKTQKPTEAAARRLREVIRYGGDWSPLDESDPFEITTSGKIVSLTPPGMLL